MSNGMPPYLLLYLTNHCMSILVSLMLLFGSMKPTEAQTGLIQKGKASFYSKKFNGRKTAYGERVNNESYAAAHRSLPPNTMVEVTNLDNQRSVIVRINDRGPYAKGRIIDLTYAAAKALGMVSRGIANVKLRVVPDKKALAFTPELSVDAFGQSAPLLPALGPVN